MDQLICASLSHTHYWYEVGMLGVLKVCTTNNGFVFVFVCVPACMAINISVQHNGGFLPGIILLTQCYYHRGTRLYAMKRFCIFCRL